MGVSFFAITNFPANHHIAERMTDADWWRVATSSAALSCAYAAVGGLVWGLLGALAVRFCAFDPSFRRQGYRQAAWAAVACALVAASGGVAGSTLFLLERPVF